MTITFVSNYINHHQIPLSNEMYKLIGDDYHFIQLEEMEEDRVLMGWQSEIGELPYLQIYSDNEYKNMKMILESDVVIYGGTDDEYYVEDRLKSGKITIRYAERFYKDGVWKAISPKGIVKKYKDHTQYNKNPVYLLCAGAYVAYDYSIVKAYPGKKFKFGYFPQTQEYDLEELFAAKQHNKIKILWAGRFIDWKHPELMIELAKYLRKKSIPFEMNMIGGGDLEGEIHNQLRDGDLFDDVHLLGYKTPTQVREYMITSNIYISTSDYHEGWGAVINEAMNSGCAVVACHALGSVPYLIEHEKNGIVYKYKKKRQLFKAVRKLISSPERRRELGENAYKTITREWNEKVVAQRLIDLCDNLSQDKIVFEKKGPLSEAEVVKERRMYRSMINISKNR